MSERRRRATRRLFSHGLLFTILLIAPLMYLSGCGPEQTTVGQTNGNSVPVSLNLSFAQQSATVETAETLTNRLLTHLQSWLPTATTAWARESVSNLSTLRVTVTGEGIQIPVVAEKQVANPASGAVVTFELNVPEGANRIFTVDGFKNQLIIFTGRSAPVSLTAGQPASVDITLADDTGTVTGTFPNGGNAGATATIPVQGTTFSAPVTGSGTFTLDGVPRGEHSLRVSAPGFIPKNIPVVVQAGNTVSVGTVVLDRIPPATGIVTGTVTNANNQAAIQGATVTVDGLSLSATTTNNGSFTIVGVPVGTHTLTVNASGFFSVTTSSIQVTVGSSSSAGTIALTPLPTTGTVTGTVTNAITQAGLTGATITVNGLSLSTTSDGNGSFIIPGVPAGRHILTVSATGFSTSTTTVVQVTARSTSNAGTIALAPITTGSITGAVINANTQAPLSDIIVRLMNSTIFAGTLKDGSFTLEEVPEGSQIVQVAVPGFQDVTKTVAVVAGQSVSTGTIALPVRTGTGTLIGKVIHATTRAPIQGALVTVVVKPTGAAFQALTNSDGNFEVLDVPAGFVTTTVSNPGFTPQIREGSVKERTSDAGIFLLAPLSGGGGGSGRLTVSNAPAEVGGTFVVDPLLSSAATSSPGLGVFWGERLTAVNGPNAEFVGLSYFPSRGDMFIEFGVRESTNSVLVVWACFTSSSSSSSCGVTLNTTTRSVSFNNSVLTTPLSNTPAITLNGTLTYPEPVTLP